MEQGVLSRAVSRLVVVVIGRGFAESAGVTKEELVLCVVCGEMLGRTTGTPGERGLCSPRPSTHTQPLVSPSERAEDSLLRAFER